MQKLKYFNTKINSFKTYNYVDFEFYNKKVENEFETWQKKIESYKKNPQNEKNLESNMQSKPLTFSINKIQNEYLKDYEIKVINQIYSLQKDLNFIKQAQNMTNNNTIYTNDNKYIKQNAISKIIMYILHKFFILRYFRNNICVLSPDFLHAYMVEIPLNKLKQTKSDSICLTKINKECKEQEYKYYTQEIKQDSVFFQIFCVSKEFLNKFSQKVKNKIYFINPFELFSTLYNIYPQLSHYTLIMQSEKYHCLCHYSYGFLDFSVIIERSQALQDYYKNIEIIGEIFYCDWSGRREYVEDYMNVEACLDMPLNDCLKMLSFAYLHNKSLESSFLARNFWNTKSFIKNLFLLAFVFIFYLTGSLIYEIYEYNNMIHTKETNYKQEILNEANKKENYEPMYNRIYSHILEKKSLNFKFKDK